METQSITTFDFGQAIKYIKEGKNVARIGWNGSRMFITLMQGYPVNHHLMPADMLPEHEGTVLGLSGQMLSHIVLKTAGHSRYWDAPYSDYVAWVASQTDILANDWVIAE